ncbi:carbohydrate binding domain-containing protein [Cohnella sp.]|uniref:carbohydrate binding domain-containing protein n=1 Tax=Cohnella sp. TaxID=1883426 RepID=UPI0035642216
MSKKLLSALLSVLLVVACFAQAVSAGSMQTNDNQTKAAAGTPFTDLQGHWAASAVATFAQAGIVSGYLDQFRPNDPVTRAEFVSMLNRVFHYLNIGQASFKDVDAAKWYADAVDKAAEAGVVQGFTDGSFHPNDAIKRQDAAVILYRAFQWSESAAGATTAFKDGDAVSKYALPAVNSLVSSGYLKGNERKELRPQSPITRAETVALLDGMIGWLRPDFGEFLPNADVKGNLIVSKPDVKLSSVTVDGNLYVTEGVGEGEATFAGITVKGRSFVTGGGVHSVIFKDAKLTDLEVNKKNSPVRVVLTGNSTAGIIMVGKQSQIEIAAGSTVKEIRVEANAKGSAIVSGGTIGRLLVSAEGVTLNGKPVAKGADLSAAEIAKGAANPSGTTNPAPSGGPGNPSPSPSDPWKLVWQDEFDGDTVDASKWNVQDTDLVYNNELEYYRPNNVYIEKDGANSVLALEAKRENYGGRHFTSGKVTSAEKGDWTYGKFVVRAKLPVSQGMWPAIWMLPTDQQYQYGGWPQSGEMDIMELTGPKSSDPDNRDVYPRKVFGTIHYDEDPSDSAHDMQSKTYLLPPGKTFADDYHEFSMEWLPGVIRMYVDGEKYFETSDWGAQGIGQPEDYTYPAPFDRPFHMILNLAVGGDMPEDPPKDSFESEKMRIDYVRVYQYKDLASLPDVTGKRPTGQGTVEPQRPPLSDGNQIYNGGFQGSADAQGVPDQWQLVLNAGGAGSVSVVDDPEKGKAAKVSIASTGSQLYSLQLTQMPVYLQKGKAYKVTFDAKADAPRTIMSKVTEFQGGWKAYSKERTFDLTDEWQTLTYSFNMDFKSDNNTRFEFNLGQTSTVAAYFTNVRIKETDWIPETPREKTVLGDGNYIYNGTFDQGLKDRMGYWTFSATGGANANVSVSNDYNPSAFLMERKLHVTIANGGASPKQVVLSQGDLKLTKGSSYRLKFDAKADHSRSIHIGLDTGAENGALYDEGSAFTLTDTMTTYTKVITIADSGQGPSALQFLFGGEGGTVVLDNVSLVENSDNMMNNGDFSQGTTGWTTYSESDPASVQLAVYDGGGDLGIHVGTTGEESWHRQVFYGGIHFQKDQQYTLTFKAKATKPRKMNISIGWPGGASENYQWHGFGGGAVDLGTEYKDYTITFYDHLDNTSIGRISLELGKIKDGDGNVVSDVGDVDVSIDDIRLVPSLIQNGDFKLAGLPGWASYSDQDPQSEQLHIANDQESLKIDVGTVGTATWNRQVYYEGINYKQGHRYTLTFKARATAARDMNISIGWLDSTFNWHGYASQVVSLNETDNTYSFTFDDTLDSTKIGRISFELGKITGGSEGNVSVYIDDLTLTDNGPAAP